MAIDFEDVNEQLRIISLSGRLDIAGTSEIELKFTTLSTVTSKRVVVDLTSISFLASIGIRALITNAKALQQRGGKMVLFVGDNAVVAKTLEMTGIDVLIPMFTDTVEAQKEALA